VLGRSHPQSRSKRTFRTNCFGGSADPSRLGNDWEKPARNFSDICWRNYRFRCSADAPRLSAAPMGLCCYRRNFHKRNLSITTMICGNGFLSPPATSSSSASVHLIFCGSRRLKTLTNSDNPAAASPACSYRSTPISNEPDSREQVPPDYEAVEVLGALLRVGPMQNEMRL